MVLFAKIPRSMTAVAAAALILALPATSAYAIGGLGDIVYDPSNYAEAIKQVQSWEQQYQQMTQALAKADASLTQLKSAVSSTTGNRGFGDLLNNPLLKAIVPSDISSTLSTLNSTGTLTGNAATIRSSTTIYNCGDITDAAAKVACQALLGQNAQSQATQQSTMALLNQRTTQIEALRGLQAEEAQVANDQNKIATANAMLVANQQAAAQAQAERVDALMATNKTSALDGFSFASLGYQPATQTADVDQ